MTPRSLADENTSLLEEGGSGGGRGGVGDGEIAMKQQQQQQRRRRNNNSRLSRSPAPPSGRRRRSSALSSQQRQGQEQQPLFSLKHSLQLLSFGAVLVLVSLGVGVMLAKRHNNDDDSNNGAQSQSTPPPTTTTTSTKYTKVQYYGFQIYTGGAPAFLEEDDIVELEDAANAGAGGVGGDSDVIESTHQKRSKKKKVPNPECHGLHSYGEAVLDVDPVLMCYIGHEDPMIDVEQRLQIMKVAVEKAYNTSQQDITTDLDDDDSTTLKIFIAPEFYFRGKQSGSYEFVSLDRVFNDKCSGPVCKVLSGLEDIVEDVRFEHWFFLFGTVVASQAIPTEENYEHLFYNFAPIYKGYDPMKAIYETKNGQVVNESSSSPPPPPPPIGKRFLLPKRYVSDSDFLKEPYATKPFAKSDGTVVGDYTRGGWDELLNAENQPNTTDNPFYKPHKRYDDHLFEEYKLALSDDAGYTMIEYDWMIVDGIVMSLEVCLDHYKKTALHTYLGDIVKGKTTRIPSTNDMVGLEFVPIPNTMAQIGLVSSAGMTMNADAMALAQHGVLFLQDGMSNATAKQYIDYDLWNTCDQGVQFDGGTEAVSRRAIVSNTDVNFLYQVHDAIQKVPIYNDDDDGEEESWKHALKNTFSTAVYEPHLIVHEALPIPNV